MRGEAAVSQIETLDGNLKGLSADVAEVQKPVDRTHNAVTTARSVLAKPRQLSVVMKGLISKAGTLSASATFLTPFPVIGTLAGRIGRILRSVKSAAEKTKKAADTVDRKIGPAKAAVKKIAPPVTKAKLSLDRAQALLQAWLAITGELQRRCGEAPPAEVEAVCGTLNEAMAPELKAIAGAKAGLMRDLAGTSQGLEDLAVAVKPVEDSLEAANDLARGLRPLEGPLRELKKALRPVKWALDAASWVTSRVIDPIVNEILKAVGLKRLVDRLERSLNPFAKHLDPLRRAAAAVDKAVARIGAPGRIVRPLERIPQMEAEITKTMRPLRALSEATAPRPARRGRKKR